MVRHRLTTGPLRGLGDVTHRALGVRVPHVRVVELRLTTLLGVELVILDSPLHERDRRLRPVRPERSELGALMTELLAEDLLPRERGGEVDAGAAHGAIQTGELGNEPGSPLDAGAALLPGTLGVHEQRRDRDRGHNNGGFGEHTLSLSWFSRGFDGMPNPSLVDT